MITKAIIEEIQDDGRHVRVRIPVYHKIQASAFATPSSELPIASICCPPGVTPAYKVNDVVFVEFENGETERPVIIGLLYRSDTTSKSNIDGNSLSIDINCSLPEDTVIGNVTAQDINNISKTKGNLQGQIDIINDKIKQLQ